MSYTVEDISNLYGQYFDANSHVTLFCWFTDSAGNKVDVTQPTATVKRAGTPVSNLVLLQDLRRVNPLDDIHQGHYSFKFLTDGLINGAEYTVEFSGQYNNTQLKVTGKFTLKAIPIVQEYINRLREMLSDERTADYLLDDPKKFKWADGKLYDFLRNTLNAINVEPPYGYQFAFETVPFIDLLLWGAMIEALFSLARKEVDNTLIYNDELSINIDRSGKYLQIAQAMLAEWARRLKMAKTSYAMSMSKPIGLKSTRLPYTILRPLSLREEMQNTFGGIL